MYSMWYVTIPLLGVSEDVSLSFNTHVSLTFTLSCHTISISRWCFWWESSARLKICLRPHWANVDPRVLCLIGNLVGLGGAYSTRGIPQISSYKIISTKLNVALWQKHSSCARTYLRVILTLCIRFVFYIYTYIHSSHKHAHAHAHTHTYTHIYVLVDYVFTVRWIPLQCDLWLVKFRWFIDVQCWLLLLVVRCLVVILCWCSPPTDYSLYSLSPATSTLPISTTQIP